MQPTKKLIRVERGSTITLNFLKRLFFKKLTANSTTIFLRGADIISVEPQLSGQHDPDLTKLIRQRVQDGYSDFFIDIGANIGLISCQVGNLFQKVVCYEPNPLCVNILRVNTAITINQADVIIRDHGLGGIAGELELWIPKHNWGGAFVRSPENSYTDETLAKKDGLIKLDSTNYVVSTVSIKESESDLTKTFSELSKQKLKKGIVKIDIEGMELAVLEGIGKALPSDMQITILLENWEERLDFELIRHYFANRKVELQKIEHVNPYKKSWARPLKAIALAFGSRKIYLQNIDACDNKTGDICLTIS